MASPIDEVIPGLWISGYEYCSPALIAKIGFDAVVCITTKKESYLKLKQTKKYNVLCLDIIDNEKYVISDSKFHRSTAFINSAIKRKHNILVHCKMGISRSATIVTAYLIKYKKMSVNDALLLVKKKHAPTFPNKGFLKQLIDWHKTVNNLHESDDESDDDFSSDCSECYDYSEY